MAAVEDDVDDRFNDIDIESLLSRVERRPLTFHRKKKSVLIAPEFLVRLKGEENVDEGEDLTLNFKVTGVPRPTLRWFKDDEEVKDHPRLSVDEGEDGSYSLTLHQVNKGDEAAYRCKAENSEGTCSCCFFLSVKGKPKSPKKTGHKRTVSYPTMFSTIVEKVEEEETAGKEASKAPASPISHFYDSLSLKGRSTWPEFLGDWAFVNGAQKNRGGSTGSYTSTGSIESDPHYADSPGEDVIRIFADAEGWEPDDVFFDSPTGEGHASDLSEAEDVVFYIETPEPSGAFGIGTVPPDADHAPPEAAPRGEAAQLLTPAASRDGQAAGQSLKPLSLRPEKDSKDEWGGGSHIGETSERGGGSHIGETSERGEGSGGDGGCGGGEGVTLPPSQEKTIVDDVARAWVGGAGSSPTSSTTTTTTASSSAVATTVTESAESVIRDKKEAASLSVAGENDTTGFASTSSPLVASASAAPSYSSLSSPLPAKPSVSSADHSVAPAQTNTSAVAAPAAEKARPASTAIPRLRVRSLSLNDADAEPSQKTPASSGERSPLSKGFSLSTGTGYSSGKPLSVRGPLGALISSNGSFTTTTTTTTSNLTSRGESLASQQHSSATKTKSGTPAAGGGLASSIKPSPVSKIPAATCSPAPSSSGSAPPLIVTPEEEDSFPSRSHRKKPRPAGKMSDCSNTEVHVCDCGGSNTSSTSSSGSSGYSSGADSAGIIVVSAPLGEFPFIPPSVVSLSSACQLAPVASSPASSRPRPGLSSPESSGSGSSLLRPEYDREEREPTPIPPDRLIVTHTPSGSSVLVQMYKGPIRPPGVPPKQFPGHLAEDAPVSETEIFVVVDSSEKASPADEEEGDRGAEAAAKKKKKKASPSTSRGVAKEAAFPPPRPPSTSRGVAKEAAFPPPRPSSREKGGAEEIHEVTKAERDRDAANANRRAEQEQTPRSKQKSPEPQPAVEEQPETASPMVKSQPLTEHPQKTKASKTAATASEKESKRGGSGASDDLPESAPSGPAVTVLDEGTEALYFDPVHGELMHITPESSAVRGEESYGVMEVSIDGDALPESDALKDNPLFIKKQGETLFKRPVQTKKPDTRPQPQPEPDSQSQPEPELEPEPQTEPELIPEPEPEPEPKPKPTIKHKLKPKAEPEPEPKHHSKFEDKHKPHVQSKDKCQYSQPSFQPESELQPLPDEQAPQWFFPSQEATTSTGRMQALYFDPAHQEILHVRRTVPDAEPVRSRSATAVKHSTRGTRRSPTPSPKGKGKCEHQQQQQQRAKSAVDVSTSREPEAALEDDLLCQYMKEVFFLICLLTFLCLELEVTTPMFVCAVLGIHLAGRLLFALYRFVTRR